MIDRSEKQLKSEAAKGKGGRHGRLRSREEDRGSHMRTFAESGCLDRVAGAISGRSLV